MQPLQRRENEEVPRDGQPYWKRELNEKIAAARARRLAGQPATPPTPRETTDSHSRASRVAAAVAARYADAPTYSEYLAAEVRAAIAAAVTQAGVAARAAANQAQTAETTSIDGAAPGPGRLELSAAVDREAPSSREAWPDPEARSDREAWSRERSLGEKPAGASKAHSRQVKAAPEPRVDHAASGFQYVTPDISLSQKPSEGSRLPYVPAASDLSDPLQEALIAPATPLPAKLLEFPRELIAARKARPRHAEGPLRDGLDEEPGQLRIFEVEPSAISKSVEAPPAATEWSSIRLDAYPASRAYPTEDIDGHTGVTHNDPEVAYSAAYNREVARSQTQYATGLAGRSSSLNFDQELPDMAGLPDRLMAGIVDAALVGIAFTLFVLVFAASTAHPPMGRPALIGGAILLAFLYLVYQLFFFSFGNATPGMRYARIALCTFDDDNPTRDAMRKRIFALVLAAAPLGLGFLYALFDDDGLGWHDRMTRMYQRSYK